jgi:hypothetical protein
MTTSHSELNRSAPPDKPDLAATLTGRVLTQASDCGCNENRGRPEGNDLGLQRAGSEIAPDGTLLMLFRFALPLTRRRAPKGVRALRPTTSDHDG